MIKTPTAVAKQIGCSERLLRKRARELGTCRILGKTMFFTDHDLVLLLYSFKANRTLEETRRFLSEDAQEIATEKEAQGWQQPTGVVYFVEHDDEVKIGFTTDLQRRLANFRTASSGSYDVLLAIEATEVLEPYFHEKFATDRVKREWFRKSDALMAFIARRKRTL